MNFTHDELGVIWFLLLGVIWAVYFAQELFILGAGALHRLVAKSDDEIKQIQYATALHWDGIEVWLILAIGGMFAAFPKAYADTLSILYIPYFLLLYAIIARGTSIELIFKTDNPKVQQLLSKIWMGASFVMVLVLGVYITNIFRGLPLDASGMTKSFIYIFNIIGIFGGVFFVALSLAMGAAWISMTTEGELGKKAFGYAKYSAYVLPWILPIMLQGMNTTDNPISVQVLFADYSFLFAVPALAWVFALLTSWFVFKQKAVQTFISGILTIILFVATGFIGSFPYLLPSTIQKEYGVSIADSMASENTLTVMFIAALIFVPIVLAYQGFKYVRFSKKVRIGDDK